MIRQYRGKNDRPDRVDHQKGASPGVQTWFVPAMLQLVEQVFDPGLAVEILVAGYVQVPGQ